MTHSVTPTSLDIPLATFKEYLRLYRFMITQKELKQIYGLSGEDLRVLLQTTDFPKPAKIQGTNSQYWNVKEVDDWVMNWLSSAQTKPL